MSNQEGRIDELRAKSSSLPPTPGVYIMRDAQGKVIYVGKAKSLKSRVSSYFKGVQDLKTGFLVKGTADIEAIHTTTEYEALVLEDSLIKRHVPRYNINLKDGKSYPVIRITAERFPRVFRTRRIIRDGSDYFGPYPDVKAVDIYIDLIYKLYPLRRCKSFKSRQFPCLYAHIGRCSAPCTGAVDEAEYGKSIKKIRALLAGRTIGFRKEVERKMKAAAAKLAFEHAAELRDALKTLDALDADYTMVDSAEDSRDYIDYVASGRHIVFAVIQMRGGQVLDRQIYINEYAGDIGEALPEFLLQYYAKTSHRPPRALFIPKLPDPLIERFFGEDGEGENRPQIMIPTKKRDMAVLAMVRQNAEAELDRLVREEGDLPALEELSRVLSLPRVPRRIEGFDVAQLHGKHTVASRVSFQDGRADKGNYRLYKIRSTDGAIDDYKSIAEAVARRYQWLLNEGKTMPDLILIDGGRGQVSAALKVLESLELNEKVSLLGLAKKKEEIWLPHRTDPVRLPLGDPGLRVLQHVRDEAHRIATAHNQRLRAKDLALSTLEGIPGIGPARSAKLLTTYKTLESIYSQSSTEIAKTAGVNDAVGETIREFLGRTLESRGIGKDAREGKFRQQR